MRKLNVNRRYCWLAGRWWRRISRDQWRHLRNSRHNSRLLVNVRSSLFKTKFNWNNALTCSIMVLFWMYTLIRLLIFNHAIRFVWKRIYFYCIFDPNNKLKLQRMLCSYISFSDWQLGDDNSDSWDTIVVSLIPSVQYAPRAALWITMDDNRDTTPLTSLTQYFQYADIGDFDNHNRRFRYSPHDKNGIRFVNWNAICWTILQTHDIDQFLFRRDSGPFGSIFSAA